MSPAQANSAAGRATAGRVMRARTTRRRSPRSGQPAGPTPAAAREERQRCGSFTRSASPGTADRGLETGRGAGWRVKLYHCSLAVRRYAMGPHCRRPRAVRRFPIRDRLGTWRINSRCVRHAAGCRPVIRGEPAASPDARSRSRACSAGRIRPRSCPSAILKPTGESSARRAAKRNPELRAAGAKHALLLGAACALGGAPRCAAGRAGTW